MQMIFSEKQRLIDQADQISNERFRKSKFLDRRLFCLNGNGGHHDLLESKGDESIYRIEFQ